MTRILHIGPFVDRDPLELPPKLRGLHSQPGLRAALASMGVTVSISWPQLLHCGGHRELQWAIRGAAQQLQPDWTFLQVQQDVLDIDTIRAIPGLVFSWSGDVRAPLPQHYLERAPHVACTSFTNTEDVETVRKAGHRAEFLQVGFDAELYQPAPQEGRFGIVFIGHNYGRFPESEERLKMVTELRWRFGKRFKLYGNGWPKELGAHPAVGPEAEASILQRSKIAICQNHFVRGRYTSDRTFRSMGCGALVLQRDFPGLGQELTVVRPWTSRDLCEQVDYYCDDANEVERAHLAECGSIEAHTQHTWAARMARWAEIMKQMEEERQHGRCRGQDL